MVTNATVADNVSVEQATTSNVVKRKTAGDPVTATLSLTRDRARAGDDIELSVTLQIAPMWEIHTLDAEPSSVATRLSLDLPSGLLAVGGWRAPKPLRSAMPDSHAAYGDKVVFTQLLRVTEEVVAGKRQIKCRVGYQACNERQCLRPTEIELRASLRIE